MESCGRRGLGHQADERAGVRENSAPCLNASTASSVRHVKTPTRLPPGPSLARPPCALAGTPGSRAVAGLPSAFQNRVLAAIRGSAPGDFRDPRRSCLTSRPWKRHALEGVHIQLGVNVRSLKETMPEHVSHLLETDPASNHLSCGRMSE